MNTQRSVERDARTVAVENASYRWACGFVSFALLIDVMFRSAVRSEAAWDLMALAILPGIASLVYQARQKTVIPVRAGKLMTFAFVAAAIAAAAAAILTMIGPM